MLKLNSFLFIIALCLFGIKIQAEENSEPFCTSNTLLYFKMGGSVLPGDNRTFLPTAGIGTRGQLGYLGFDLSSNVSTTLLNNYIALKGLVLFYPVSIFGHHIYFGMGAAAGYRGKISLKGRSADYTGMTAEAVIGYEFTHYRYFRKFIQVEISEPLYNKEGNRLWRSKTPGITLLSGVGF